MSPDVKLVSPVMVSVAEFPFGMLVLVKPLVTCLPPVKPALLLIPVAVMLPILTATDPTFLMIRVALVDPYSMLSIAMLLWAAMFCAPCWLPVDSLVWARNPCAHMNMITDMATATATMSRVARTGATACLLRSILTVFPQLGHVTLFSLPL